MHHTFEAELGETRRTPSPGTQEIREFVIIADDMAKYVDKVDCSLSFSAHNITSLVGEAPSNQYFEVCASEEIL